jgi:hypothetical protein
MTICSSTSLSGEMLYLLSMYLTIASIYLLSYLSTISF